MAMAAYFNKMHIIKDELVAAGKPIDYDDVVSHMQNGLHLDYNPIF